LKKKALPTANKDVGKGGGDKDKSYIPPAVMDAIHKEGRKNGGKMIAWMLKGCTQEWDATKQTIKGAKTQEGDKDDDDAESKGSAEPEEVPEKSAFASMGRKSKNRHPHNPNGSKARKINAIQMVSLQIKKAMTVEHPSNYRKLF